MTSVIILGGTAPSQALLDTTLSKCDFVVAADSGIKALSNQTRKADVHIGDFDSSDGNKLSHLAHKTLSAPSQDASDFQKALAQCPPETKRSLYFGRNRWAQRSPTQ